MPIINDCYLKEKIFAKLKHNFNHTSIKRGNRNHLNKPISFLASSNSYITVSGEKRKLFQNGLQNKKERLDCRVTNSDFFFFLGNSCLCWVLAVRHIYIDGFRG